MEVKFRPLSLSSVSEATQLCCVLPRLASVLLDAQPPTFFLPRERELFPAGSAVDDDGPWNGSKPPVSPHLLQIRNTSSTAPTRLTATTLSPCTAALMFVFMCCFKDGLEGTMLIKFGSEGATESYAVPDRI
ncbi:hypothetical protein R3P38DRAFT_2710448 [Favolaschia claudopus]|uniref:Uncharacterized protein n=1 Tax=Favolaschia claudopus TaxID=2862362 RepID=A0AAW0B9I2_9AGAR